jgi:hypothetical protein
MPNTCQSPIMVAAEFEPRKVVDFERGQLIIPRSQVAKRGGGVRHFFILKTYRHHCPSHPQNRRRVESWSIRGFGREMQPHPRTPPDPAWQTVLWRRGKSRPIHFALLVRLPHRRSASGVSLLLWRHIFVP